MSNEEEIESIKRAIVQHKDALFSVERSRFEHHEKIKYLEKLLKEKVCELHQDDVEVIRHKWEADSEFDMPEDEAGRVMATQRFWNLDELQAWQEFMARFRNKKNLAVLDFGCGNRHIVGRNLPIHTLHERGFKRALGLDISYTERDSERHDYREVRGYTFEGKSITIPLDEKHKFVGKFDVVVASNVLNVLESMDTVLGVLEEVRDFLKPGGMAIMSYPDTPRKLRDAAMTNSAMSVFIRQVFGNVYVESGKSEKKAVVFMANRGAASLYPYLR